MTRPALTASNLHAARLCPAKPSKEKGFSDVRNEYSDRGELLHRYFLSTLPRESLSADDRDFVVRADELAHRFVTQFMEDHKIEGVAETREKELHLDGPVPGTPDIVLGWQKGDYIAILDLKSGFMAVDAAPSNEQLAAYAALRWRKAKFKVCGVAIISPDAFGPRLTSAFYTGEVMPGVLEYIDDIKARTEDPNAEAVAGDEQCRFCKATAVCDAWRARYLAPTVKDLKIAVRDVSNEDLAAGARVIQACKGKRGDEWMHELKRRVIEGEIEGWRLQNTGEHRQLTGDPLEALECINIYLAASQKPEMSAGLFDACRDMNFGRLIAEFQHLSGLNEKDAKEMLYGVITRQITSTPKAQAVKEVRK